MTEQDQFAAINTRQWYTDMRLQLAAIMSTMQTTGFSVDDGGWITTEVESVPARFQMQPGGTTAILEAGVGQNGEPLFTWLFPVGWLS